MADIESNIKFGIDTSDAMASIKMLQAQISAFQRQMASSSAANADSARKLRRGLIDDLAATGQWSASIKTIKSSSESFTTALEKNKLSMGEYFRFAGGATQKFGRLFTAEFNTIEKVARERVKDLQTQYISLGRDANGALKSIAVRPLKLDMNDLATQTAMNAQKQQIFNQLLKQGSTNLLNFGKNTQWAGRQLMVGFTIPLSIFGGIASKTFMEIEEQAIRFRRVYGDAMTTISETDEAISSMKELASEFTKYGVEISKTIQLAADAAQMGLQGADLREQVANATRLAVLGEVEQQEALKTSVAITNTFAVATENLADKINFLNIVENETMTAISDLTVAIPKAGPAVRQLGGSVEDLAFFLTAMKEGGINASEGANALKSGLASIINPTRQSVELLKLFNVNITEIRDANRGDIKGLFFDLAEALDALDPGQRAQAIEQLFGKFQFSRISTLLQNVVKEGSQAQRVLELTNSTTKELAELSDRELRRVEESTTFRFRSAVEQFQSAIAPIGEEFLKLITPIIEFATKIIEKFNSLSDGAKSFITGLTVLLGAVGPVALMTFGLLANGVANIIKGFVFVRDVFLKTGRQSQVLGEQIDYMTQEQLNAAAVAASLDQTHQQLIQTFSVEAGAVKSLADVYRQAFNEQQRFDTGRSIARQAGIQPGGLRLNSGIVSVPGPRGAGDIIPAMLSPGEAVIPAAAAKKYAPLVEGMVSGNIPGFNKGVVNLGMPRSGKSTAKNRDAAEQIYQMFLQSSYRNTPPTEYGHQLAPTSGHSFPIFGLGGVYMSPAGKKVFVKPVMDEKAALAEMRGTQIARQVHGLKAPEQRIVVLRDPQDVTRKRRFLALESNLDSTFINNDPMAVFNEDQYFKQLVASLLRVDKDLSPGNVFGDVVADVGPAGVFTRASGVRDYAESLPSMEEQAMINLLGIKGGAKRAFAESTLALMSGLTPQQYHQKMISEIQQVLPLLKQTVAGFGLTDPREVKVYDDMIRRLEQGLTVDWSKFHAIHSAVKPSKPKQTANPVKVPGYADGVVSVPGPKGKGDVMPAMLSPGEAVIPTKMAKKYAPLIEAMISGNIPGYNRGLFTSQSRRFGQSGEASAQASHFGMFTPSRLSDTLGELTDELGDIAVVVYTIGEKLEDGSRQVEKSFVKMSDLANRNIDLAAGGMTYSGTTTIESRDRNQAYNAAAIAGAAFTLEEAAENGRLAQQAIASGTTASKKYAAQLEQLVLEGAQAERLLAQSNSAEERLAFIKKNSEKALVESLLSQTEIKSADEAELLATEMLSNIQKQIAELQASGMDEEQLLQEAKRKYAALLIRSGTGEFVAGDPGTGGTSIRDVATGRGRRDLVRVFADGDEGSRKFASGGRSTAAVSSSLFVKAVKDGMDELVAAAKIAGSSTAQSFKNGAAEVQGEILVAGEDVGESSVIGMRQTADDAQLAGQSVMESAISGIYKVGTRRVTTDPSVMARYKEDQGAATQAESITPRKEPRRATSGGTMRFDESLGKYVVKAKEATDTTQKLTQANSDNAVTVKNSTDRLQKLNSGFNSGLFAITSLAGAGVMMDGAIGELSQTIFKFSGVAFALIQVTQLLTQAKILELAATRLSIAKNAAFGPAVGPKTAAQAATGLSATFARLGTFVSKLFSPIGWVVLGLTALAGVIGLLVKINNDQKEKIEGLGNTAFLTAEKMKKAGELLGFEGKTSPFGQNITAGTASAAFGSGEAELISNLRGNKEFTDSFRQQIEAIRDAGIDQAESALKSLAIQQFAAGAEPEQVSAFVKAIAQEAGRTDLNLSFASIGLDTEEGIESIGKTAQEASERLGEAVSDGVIVPINMALRDGTRQFRQFGAESNQIAGFVGAQYASSFQALKDGLENGIIKADDFGQQLELVNNSILSLSSESQAIAVSELSAKLGLSDALSGVKSIRDQLLLISADAAGIDVSEDLLSALEQATNDVESQKAANRARDILLKKLKEEATLREEIAAKAEEQRLIDEAVAAANNQLIEQNINLEDQIEAYNILIEQGYELGDAITYATNSTIAQGLAAATTQEEIRKILDLINANIDLNERAESLFQRSSGGTAEKTPIQQATEQLKEQREEILNASSAYTKLRNAGFGIKAAMEAAENPILAAALASTKVGTDAWIKLTNKIQEVTNLLNKKELQDLLKTGRIEIDNRRNQVSVSTALNALGWDLEGIQEVLNNPELTNTLAKDLEDGVINSKQLLNALSQIKQMEKLDVELNLTTKEGAANEFEKRYDKVVGSLEAQKRVIEIEFRAQTLEDSNIVTAAQNQIAALQYQIDDYEAGLTRLEDDEKAINEEYDRRKNALDKIAKINEDIANRQKSQLDIASALSKGDVAAAARASQEMRAQAQQDAMKAQQDRLELSRERRLSNLGVDVNGRVMTRKDIEQSIADIKKQIFEIEEDTLEPANERIRLAGVEKDAAVAALDAQILKWDQLSAKVNAAKLSLTPEEISAMETQAKLIADMLENWDDIKDRTATLTILKKTLDIGADGDTSKDQGVGPTTTGSSSGSPSGSGGGGAPSTTATGAPPSNLVGGTVGGTKGLFDTKPKVAEVTAGEKTVAVVSPAVAAKIKQDADKRVKDALAADKRAASTNVARTGGGGGGIGLKFLALGGKVFGPGTSTSDSIPAMLSDGEYVVRASSVSKLGVDFLDFINKNGKLPKFAFGGLVIPGKPTTAKSKSTPKINTSTLAGVLAASGMAPKSKPKVDVRAAMAADKKATSAALSTKPNVKAAMAADKKASENTILYKTVGGAQGFEAGFQGLMSDIAKNPVVQAIGEAYSADNLGGQAFRAVVGALSVPVETVGSLAKSFVDSSAMLANGDIAGAISNSLTALPRAAYEGITTSFSGVANAANQRDSMFEQAAQSAIENNLFGAKNNPQMAALARVIGGSLNILGDPLTYIGAGLVTRGVRTAATAGRMSRGVGSNSSIRQLEVPNTREDVRDFNTGAYSVQARFIEVLENAKNGRMVGFKGFTSGVGRTDLSGILKSEDIVLPTPANLINLAMTNTPTLRNARLNRIASNFEAGKIGAKETSILDMMNASVFVDDLGNIGRANIMGLRQVVEALRGNRATAKALETKTNLIRNRIQENRSAALASQADSSEPFLKDVVPANPKDVSVIHSTGHGINRDAQGNVILRPSGEYQIAGSDMEYARSSLHFTLEDSVKDHTLSSWNPYQQKIVAPLSSIVEKNGTPYALNPVDTFWTRSPGEPLVIPDAGIVTPYKDFAEYSAELVRRGLIAQGDTAPQIASDLSAKEVLYHLPEYLTNANDPSSLYELQEQALRAAKDIVGTKNSGVAIRGTQTNSTEFDKSIQLLANSYGSKIADHIATFPAKAEGVGTNRFTQALENLSDADSIDAMRFAALLGRYPTAEMFEKIPGAKPSTNPRIIDWEDNQLASGGLVKARYLRMGGLLPYKAEGGQIFKPLGTDKVPAMLTPGEFVVSRPAVQNYGVDRLRAINSGATNTDSVYNYSVNVNVKSDANPDQIAKAVMTQIKQIDSMKLRGNRL